MTFVTRKNTKMGTPEGRVKDKVRKILAGYGNELYAHWPVPSGYGRSSLDVIACYRGRFFSVETKADGKKPTLRQTGELNAIGLAMGKTFVLAGVDDPGFVKLVEWLEHLKAVIPYDPNQSPDQTNRRRI